MADEDFDEGVTPSSSAGMAADPAALHVAFGAQSSDAHDYLRKQGRVAEKQGRLLELQIERRFHQTHVDASALASRMTAKQRGEHTLHEMRAGQDVGNRHTDRHRSLRQPR